MVGNVIIISFLALLSAIAMETHLIRKNSTLVSFTWQTNLRHVQSVAETKSVEVRCNFVQEVMKVRDLVSGDLMVHGQHVRQDVVQEIRRETDKEETKQEQVKILLAKDSRKKLKLAVELFQRTDNNFIERTFLTCMQNYADFESLCS
jgi:hypothetical protein